MKKRCKSVPKHVRLVRAALVRLGVTEMRQEVNGRYILSWRFRDVPMHLNVPLSPKGNAVESATGNIRWLFRQHGFSVPA